MKNNLFFFQKFLQNPLVGGLYFDTWYDGTTTPPEMQGFIFFQNKVKNLLL
jgi:hypothetical protein